MKSTENNIHISSVKDPPPRSEKTLIFRNFFRFLGSLGLADQLLLPNFFHSYLNFLKKTSFCPKIFFDFHHSTYLNDSEFWFERVLWGVD
jgi:hypothetical protein